MKFAGYTAQLIALFMLMAGSSARAQNDSVSFYKKYELETIYLSGKGYIKNNQSFKLRNLSTEFNFSPQGLQMYRSYRTDLNKFKVYYIVGLGILYSGIILTNQNKYDASAALLISGFVPIGFSLHFAIRSQNRLSKAIWIRNRDVLLTK